jgi:hypothetical protein
MSVCANSFNRRLSSNRWLCCCSVAECSDDGLAGMCFEASVLRLRMIALFEKSYTDLLHAIADAAGTPGACVGACLKAHAKCADSVHPNGAARPCAAGVL